MKISISVVLYNNLVSEVDKLISNLYECLPSESECELYFINNSPDNREIAKFLQQKSMVLENFHEINAKENKGFGSGHNLAIRQINSDFHIIVNPDVTIPDRKQIEIMIRYMIDNEVVLLSPLIKDDNGKIQKLVKHSPTVLDMGLRFLGTNIWKQRQNWFNFSETGYDHVFRASNFPGSFLVFETKTLQAIGGFDERFFLYMEDSDISRSMSLKGNAVFFPGAYVLHQWQRNNRKSLKGILQMLSSMRKYFNKWGWKFW